MSQMFTANPFVENQIGIQAPPSRTNGTSRATALPSSLDAEALKRLLPKPEPLEEIAVGTDGDFEFWQAELQRSRDLLEREEREDEWDGYIKYQDYVLPPEERYNFIAPQINDLINEVTGERPDISVKVKRKTDEHRTAQLEALLSWDIDTRHGWNVVQKIVRDAAWFGIGWGKQIWQGSLDSTFGPDSPELTQAVELGELARIDWEHQTMFAFMQPITVQPTDVDWLHIERHKQLVSQPLTPIELRLALEAHIAAHEAQAFNDDESRSIQVRVDPRNMLYDPDVDEPNRFRWIAERSVEVFEDMQQNRIYRKAAVKGLRPEEDNIDKKESRDGTSADVGLEPERSQGQPRLRVVDVWRIYDQRNERLILYSPQQTENKLLNVLDWPYRGSIWRPLVLVPVSRQVEGVPMPRMLHTAHLDLSFLTVAHRDAIRKAPHQQRFIRRGALENAEQQAILDGSRDDIIVNIDPNSAIKIVDPPKINPEMFSLRDELFDYQNRTLRSSEVSQGITGGAKFATEIEALLAAQGRSLRTLREAVKDWAEAMKWLQKAQYHDFGSADLIVQITGGEGVRFDPLDPSEIPLDAEVIVDLDSFSAVNREVQKRLVRELFQMITASPQLMTMFTPEGWIDFFSRMLRLHGVRDAASMLAPAAAAQMIGSLQQQAAASAPPQSGLAGAAPPLGAGVTPQAPTPGGLAGTVQGGLAA